MPSEAGVKPKDGAALPQNSSERVKTSISGIYLGMMIIGFGFFLAWQNILMSPSLLPPALEGFSKGNWFYLQDALFLALLALGALVAKKRGSIPCRIEIFWISAALLAVSTYCEYLFAYQEPLQYGGAVVCYFLMVFRAPIIVLWGEMLCTVTPNNSLFVIGGGYCFGFAINFGVSCMDASGVFVTHAILPMLSAMAFHVLRKEKVSETIVRSNKRVMLSRFPFALLIGIGLFGFVMRMLFDFSEMRVDVPDELATVYAGLAVSLAVSIFALLYRRDISYVQFGRLIMPATVIIALSIAATENGHQSYEAFLIASVWMVYKLFSWAIIRAVAFKSEQL